MLHSGFHDLASPTLGAQRTSLGLSRNCGPVQASIPIASDTFSRMSSALSMKSREKGVVHSGRKDE
jgi:hypothetical protein